MGDQIRGMAFRLAISLLLCVSVSACNGLAAGGGGQTASDGSFQKRYSAARSDLEAGRYKAAERKYRALADNYPNSQIALRLNLELAHALLRNGQAEDAAQVARRMLAEDPSGDARGMVLAVQGTAMHELARSALDSGDQEAARQRLLLAAAALGEVLRDYPEQDVGGAMARRNQLISRQLGELG
ncbi:outer membrane protein assembly factor BamD [Ferrimonas balearica]|nr:outer membrane protein assembly factor BamD [Ferrimonas balearica]